MFRWGAPNRLLSDQGREFVAKVILYTSSTLTNNIIFLCIYSIFCFKVLNAVMLASLLDYFNNYIMSSRFL